MTEIISWVAWSLDSDILSLCNDINYFIMGIQPHTLNPDPKTFQGEVF